MSMNRTILMFIALAFWSCKHKECTKNETFTMKLHFYNGTNGVKYNNLSVRLRTSDPDMHFTDLDQKTTDSQGNVTLTYDANECKDYDLSITSDIFDFFDLPARKNFSDTFTISTYGKVEVSLNTATPLTTDTLFLYYFYWYTGMNPIAQVDTIYSASNGFYKSFRCRPYPNKFIIAYGRGINNYKKMYNKGGVTIRVDGDPVINKYTINY